MNAAVNAARCTLTYAEAETRHRLGFMSDQEWRWYRFFWVWCCPRFSNVAHADAKQERAYQRLGEYAYHRRMHRVNKLRSRLKEVQS